MKDPLSGKVEDGAEKDELRGEDEKDDEDDVVPEGFAR